MGEAGAESAKTEATGATEATAATEAAATPAATESAATLPASPLAGADGAKHEGASKEAPKADGADAAKAEVTAETKPETKESGAESAAKEPSETKAETKPDGAGETKPEAKTEEVKPEAKTESKEAPAETKPQAPPVYDALKLPDTVKLDDARVKAFDDLMGQTELSGKVDHAIMGELRQKLADFHVAEVQNVIQQVQKHQVDVWNRLIEDRVNDLKKDPELGGNRIETALGNAKYALETMVPGFSKEDAAEWIKIADAGGVSHHRLTIKLLNKIYDLFAEPAPVPGQLPLTAVTQKEPGKRGWYDTVDGKAAS